MIEVEKVFESYEQSTVPDFDFQRNLQKVYKMKPICTTIATF